VNDRTSQLQEQQQHLWVGIGCQRGTSRRLIETAIQQVCKENQLNQSAIAGLATIDNKAREVGLVEFCQLRNFYLKTFPAEILRQVCVPNPSKIIAKAMGTPSVAEAAAMLAAANIERQSTIVTQIGKNEEKLSTHQFLQLNAHLCNLTPSSTDWRVRCLVPKQIFRLPGEPGTVTIAVATVIQLLSKHS
jgi:cobalt-precorrin 5A hydrolase